MENEDARVGAHLARAESAARTRSAAATLDPLRGLARALLLDALAEYRVRGCFPRNELRATATPIFVDARGTRCAMAHLLELGGEGALVARITRERNLAYVEELADEPRLVAWLAAAGLTVAEAAAIQPSYCKVQKSACLCGGTSYGGPSHFYDVPAKGLLDASVVTSAQNGRATVRVDAIHGEAFGYRVGDEVAVWIYYSASPPPGRNVLVPIPPRRTGEDGGATPIALLLSPTGGFNCGAQQGGGVAPSLSKDDLVGALRATDCHEYLARVDRRWSSDYCARDLAGCASGADAPTTLAVLLALAAALVARRLR